MTEPYTVEVPRECPRCGERLDAVKVIPSCGMARVLCQTCGYLETLRHIETADKRTSTQLGKWAKAVKERDGEKCVICGSTDSLEAHHIIPVNNDTDRKYVLSIGNGITLCKQCHKMAHKK